MDTDNKATTDNYPKEENNLVKKAETLKSLDELALSRHARIITEKKFGTDMERLVKTMRQYACPYNPDYIMNSRMSKYMKELFFMLDDAGFIRRDIDSRTWNVWKLYDEVLGKKANYILGPKLRLISQNDFGGSDEYETMPAVSDEDIEELMSVLGTLTAREKKVLELCFGLDGEDPKNLKTVGEVFDVSAERIRQVEVKALRKMRHPIRKCKLPPLFGFIPPEKPPTEYDLYSSDKPLNPETGIEILCLNIRTYNGIKRYTRICTIGDALNYSKEDWSKIRNFGRRSMDEVVEKMHIAGYEDFSI